MSLRTAFRDTDCVDCGGLIGEGDPIYFTDDGKLCDRCAMRDELVCPECKGQKKSEYGKCWECNQADRRPGSSSSTPRTTRTTPATTTTTATRKTYKAGKGR